MRPATTIIVTALCLSVAHGAWAADPAEDRGALQDYLKRALNSSGDVRYRAAAADLNGDGVVEMVVYITSPDFCGSGGCNTLVLQRQGQSYRLVMNATITWPPIRLLKSRTHGWRDIGVTVGGGGINPSYEAVMSFNGKRYRYNPSMEPAARRHAAGTVVISAGSKDGPSSN